MGENFDSIMDNYFEDFKERMNNRFRIPSRLVEEYKDDVCFMVDCDKVYIQAVRPRVAWVKPLPYEVNIDETKDIIEALVNEPVDPRQPIFGTYDEAKARIELEIKIPQAISRGKKRAAKLRTAEGPLMLTEGKGEDAESEEAEEEKSEEELPAKKKGKVIITKPRKEPTAVFTRKGRKGVQEPVLVKPPLTLEQRLKQLEAGPSFTNFKAIKFESRTEQEKMQIEDLVLSKMGRWKYSPDQIASQVSKELLERLQLRWDAAVKTVKDIYEQTLRNLLPSLTNQEVKKSLKDHEGNMMIRFHTCLVLVKDIEHIVSDATNMWKNIYHKPDDDTVIIEDYNSSDDKDESEDEGDDSDGDEGTPGDLQQLLKEVEKQAEQELKDEAEKAEEEDSAIIADKVIASPPHSPAKSGEIVSTPASSFEQSPPISQLQVQTMQVSNTSSTELQTPSSTELLPVIAVSSLPLPASSTECIVSVPTGTEVLTSPIPILVVDSPTTPCTALLSSFDNTSTSLVSSIPVLTASQAASTIVSISKAKDAVTESIPMRSMFLGKTVEEDIDLDKDIVIPKIDLDTASIDEMRMLSQLLEQKARQRQLRNERDREYSIIENAKCIITEAIGVDVDSSQHILSQLEEAVNKFNEDASGQEKLIERAAKKFDNKVLGHIAQNIAVNQVALTSVLADIENSFNNVTSLFAKLCDVTEYTKGIREKLNKIDEDLKVSAQNLKLDPSSSSSHHLRIKFLSEKQAELLREEGRIRTTLVDIQNMILPSMDSMQKHITYSKTLIHDNNFSIADHVIELSAEVQVALSTCKLLQENWDKTLQLILQVHSEFISHFGVTL